MNRRLNTLKVLAIAALVPLAACDTILDVESPGRISDDDLNTKDAIAGAVTGMAYDLTQAMDEIEFLALAGMEVAHGGSYSWNQIPQGQWDESDIGGEWSDPQQARWVAEQGIERFKGLLTDEEFGRSPDVARAHIYAGMSNRTLGEWFCSSVIDGGPEIDHAEHFSRAEGQFRTAIDIASTAGRNDLANAARGGLASVLAWQGNWSEAASVAAQVPNDMLFEAEFDLEVRNELAYETHSRNEYTLKGTIFEAHPDDPRLGPWSLNFTPTGDTIRGANGSTAHLRQEKYDDNDDNIPLTKGAEMLLLRAEAALRSGDIGEAYARMNEARTDVYGMDPLPVAATMAAAWDDLQYERAATLFGENRRIWDLRRWSEDSSVPNPPNVEGRNLCFPISEAERRSNPNLSP